MKAIFIAGMMSAIPLLVGMKAKEMNLLKLFMFPLVSRCIVDKLLELGYLPTVPYGSVISYMLACFIITYGYLVERHTLAPSMYKMVDSYARLTDTEARFLNVYKTHSRVRINEKYW